MKYFYASLAIMSFILVSAISFYSYSGAMLPSYTERIEKDIISDVYNDDFESASADLDNLSVSWNSFRYIAAFFLATDRLNEVDSAFSRASAYISSGCREEASVELSSLSSLIFTLYQDERITPGNVF